LGLGNTTGVNTLTNDGDCLVELFVSNRLTLGQLRLKDDLCSALQVKREFWDPVAFVLENRRCGPSNNQCKDDTQPQQSASRLTPDSVLCLENPSD